MTLFIQQWNKDSTTAELLCLRTLMKQEATAMGVQAPDSMDKVLNGVQKGFYEMAIDTSFRLHINETIS